MAKNRYCFETAKSAVKLNNAICSSNFFSLQIRKAEETEMILLFAFFLVLSPIPARIFIFRFGFFYCCNNNNQPIFSFYCLVTSAKPLCTTLFVLFDFFLLRHLSRVHHREQIKPRAEIVWGKWTFSYHDSYFIFTALIIIAMKTVKSYNFSPRRSPRCRSRVFFVPLSRVIFSMHSSLDSVLICVSRCLNPIISFGSFDDGVLAVATILFLILNGIRKNPARAMRIFAYQSHTVCCHPHLKYICFVGAAAHKTKRNEVIRQYGIAIMYYREYILISTKAHTVSPIRPFSLSPWLCMCASLLVLDTYL